MEYVSRGNRRIRHPMNSTLCECIISMLDDMADRARDEGDEEVYGRCYVAIDDVRNLKKLLDKPCKEPCKNENPF